MNLSNGKGLGSTASSSGSCVAADVISDQFPAGLRVLVVDDDPTCLMILERMLRTCLYVVTKCNRAEIALSLLRENRSGFDIVISDVHMPDMDGFKLLEHIGLEMDLPVIMMSADDGKNVVMKGVTHGACDYLIKPVRIEALKNIWQHVIRKRKNEWKELEQPGRLEDGDRPEKPSEDADYSSSANEGSWRNSKRRKDEEDEAEDRDDTSSLKKPRVVWSVELHQQFVTAVNQLGIDKAVPKRILELMNVPGLSRENVASHLQKYRLYLRRLSGVSQHQSGVNTSYVGTQEATFGALSSLNGLDLQAYAVTGQLPAQSLAALQDGLGRSNTKSGITMPLVDPRNVFSFENPKFRFGEVQQQQLSNNGKQMNLLHGIPTNMEPKQLANLRQSAQSLESMNLQVNAHGGENSSILMQMAQQQTRGHMVNGTTVGRVSGLPSSTGQPILSNGSAGSIVRRNGIAENGRGAGYNTVSQNSSMLNFPVNPSVEVACNNSLTSKGSYQEDINLEMKGSGRFAQSYDICSDLHQRSPHNWELQNVALTSQPTNSLKSNLDVSTSDLVQQRYYSSQISGQSRNSSDMGQAIFSAAEVRPHRNAQHIGQHLNTLISDNSIRVKAERVPDAICQVTGMLFPEEFGQEDLMSALLKQQDGRVPTESEFDFDGYTMDNIPV